MYWVFFRGTTNGEYIEANTLHDAKWIFAIKNGLKSISYITGKNQKIK
jgi:hypothetical protein